MFRLYTRFKNAEGEHRRNIRIGFWIIMIVLSYPIITTLAYKLSVYYANEDIDLETGCPIGLAKWDNDVCWITIQQGQYSFMNYITGFALLYVTGIATCVLYVILLGLKLLLSSCKDSILSCKQTFCDRQIIAHDESINYNIKDVLYDIAIGS